MGKATAYAKQQGVSVYGEFSSWWLRSPGDDTNRASRVSPFGYVLSNGQLVSSRYEGVRLMQRGCRMGL